MKPKLLDNCPAGTYRRPYIEPTCTKCGTNTFSALGAAECTECSAGTVANEAHTNCGEQMKRMRDLVCLSNAE